MARKASRKAKNTQSARGSKAKTGAASRARSSKAKPARSTKARTAGPAKRGKQAAGRGPARAASSRKAASRPRATGKGARKQSAPAKRAVSTRQDPGRSRGPVEEFADVTAEVQERSDTEDDDVPTPPSTLNLDRHASAARTGHEQISRRRRKHTAASPLMTGGDVDADWEQAYFVGDESATADNPTPDQSEVEDMGRAVGVEYEDNEELKSTPKVESRDRKRWELDPASSEDYPERNRKKQR